MAAAFGGNGYLLVNSNNLSTYLKSGGLDAPLDTFDVSTWGSTAKSYITGLEDGTFSLDGVWDATVDGYIAGLKGDSRAFEYGPAGNDQGYVKYSGNVILTSFNISNDLSGEIKFTATLQVTGGVSRGTFA